MVREIKEELGIDVLDSDLIPFGKREYTLEQTNSHITYFYYMKCNLNESDFIIQEEELSEVKWFDFDQVINMILSHDESTVFKENRIYLFKLLKELN